METVNAKTVPQSKDQKKPRRVGKAENSMINAHTCPAGPEMTLCRAAGPQKKKKRKNFKNPLDKTVLMYYCTNSLRQ